MNTSYARRLVSSHLISSLLVSSQVEVRGEIPVELQPLVDGLKAITGSLAALTLNGSEKKQLAECERGCSILFDRLATPNAVDPDTIAKTQTLAMALQAKDYGTAGSMSQQMANTVWKDHKDWLKGMKFLTQLTAKKL